MAGCVPKPIGIVTADDRIGLQVLEVCIDSGVRVPRDAAVVGSGNDATVCEAAPVPLSSVDAGLARVGEAACAMLEDLMRGLPGDTDRYLPPLEVVQRASSDVLATGDEIVAEALHRIRGSASKGLTAETLSAGLPLSRSAFERRFRKAIGRSPMRELQRVRVEEAKRRLTRGNQTLEAIAQGSGFASPQRFYTVFKQATGLTPRRYQAANRQRPS